MSYAEGGDLLVLSSAPRPPGEREAPPPEWRCFHCDEVFTTWGSAQDHFGAVNGATPGCLIDRVAIEEGGKPERGRGLLMALRKAEDAHRELLRRQCDEDTELHREIASLRCEKDEAARRAEEAGYARGLDEAIKQCPRCAEPHLFAPTGEAPALGRPVAEAPAPVQAERPPLKQICERCQMRLDEHLGTYTPGVRGGTAWRCAVCLPIQAASGRLLRDEVVRLRKQRMRPTGQE